MIHSILAIIEFELFRILTIQRMAVALVMSVFPPFMITILSSTGALAFPEFVICILCGMICLLSLLLWATPNVYAELEGKSWTFVTSRPHGRIAILIGKYLIAVIWSFLVAWIGMSLCIVAVNPEMLTSKIPKLELWVYLSILLFLASTVYAAIFSFLGVIVQRRAMVVAVGYFMIVEIGAAIVPAVVGKIAMSYHLLCLLIQWVTWILPQEGRNQGLRAFEQGSNQGLRDFELLYGVGPVWLHLLAIATMTVIMLTASAFVIRSKEYLTLEDSQV